MRAFYTDARGFTANLCRHFCRESTRLVVRDPDGHTLNTHWYDTWDDALAALRSMLPGAVNDLTHEPLA